MSDSAARLDAIVCDVLSVPHGSVAMDARFIEDLGADSLMFVDVLADIEDALGIVIPPSDMVRMTTLAGVHDVVARLRPAP